MVTQYDLCSKNIFTEALALISTGRIIYRALRTSPSPASKEPFYILIRVARLVLADSATGTKLPPKYFCQVGHIVCFTLTRSLANEGPFCPGLAV